MVHLEKLICWEFFGLHARILVAAWTGQDKKEKKKMNQQKT